MQRFGISVGLLALVAACTHDVATPRRGEASTPRDAKVLVPPTDVATDEATSAAMRAHYRAGAEILSALVTGKLDLVHAAAVRLMSVETQAKPGWEPYLAELRAASEQLEHAVSIPGAAAPAAKVARACGSCHQALDVHPRLPLSPPPMTRPVRDDDLARSMDHHSWAADRLWDGLVGPSDERWQQGATALAAARFTPPSEGLRADLDAIATRHFELARAAGAITGLEARTDQFARLLATCTGCHALIRQP